MKKPSILSYSIGILLSLATICSGQTIFTTDFGAFADGPIANATGWEGQPLWTISGGNATLGSTFQRARNFSPIIPNVGDSVVVTLTDVVFTGAGNGGNTLYTFGLAAQTEHTGSQVPQVGSELEFTGTNLTVGGAVDPNYNAGSDVFNATMTFVRLNDGNWNLTSSLTNTTDAMTYNGSTITATNLVGTSGGASDGLTLSQYLALDPGVNNALYGMRGNTSGVDAAIAIGGVTVDFVSVPEPSTFALIGGLLAVGYTCYRRRRFTVKNDS
ncbi:PEP-CTERM sorting domain-containing protein [Rubellicoccus peritrichatus]|uniref:PEP-CTERM sorting domain-containing protein n=1 Tax=Rubellicoccus peritrichatus TaxID=3080537 RepID=A0AAQ3QYB2_9BACT|nr:PEP-CTERM sorting domain-containing protein [Puniceicoccus sp. CR14]WOO43635.1 PEP-CTERM sorting domain-containing protein [Puniceicoccus sp. CR14]